MAILHALRVSKDHELTLGELARVVSVGTDRLRQRMFELTRVGWVDAWRSYVAVKENGRTWIDCEGFAFTLREDGSKLADVVLKLERLSPSREDSDDLKQTTISDILNRRSRRRYREPFALS